MDSEDTEYEGVDWISLIVSGYRSGGPGFDSRRFQIF
jgi:hypothetical protein